MSTPARLRVAIVGGGLAGLAAAVALADAGCRIDLYEARRQLGGRAASFRDPATGELVDYCQHVSLGCCTNLADFCRRTAIDGYFRRDRVLHFFTAAGRRYDFAADSWLPAPLHLARALLGLGFLTLGERLHVARTLRRLAALRAPPETTVAAWLREQGTSPRVIEQFWGVVLVSALGESLERASLPAARHVFVSGFMSAGEASDVLIPQLPLSQLFDQHVARWLAEREVQLHLGAVVTNVHIADGRAASLLVDGELVAADAVIVAVPWRRVAALFAPDVLQGPLVALQGAASIKASPITGVHLWFDRPITPLPHAVLVGMKSQWLFNRGTQHDQASAGPANSTNTGHYYQVVISASHELAARDRDEVVAEVIGELAGIWPAARAARLLSSRVVTDPQAVFSACPGFDALRPRQATPIENLALAGDWTATGWPATMEGAVRSGYAAAEAITSALGKPCRYLRPDLARGALSRWFT